MKFISGGLTDTGISRTNNEDNFCIDDGIGLFVVADGMGGHSAGEIASKMAVDVIRDYIKRSAAANEPFIGEFDRKKSETTNRLASGVRLANKAIYETSQNNPSWRGMGTTVAAALLSGNGLSIAHVGDSRVYLVRANSIEQLTDDHSIVSEQVRQGLLTKEEAEGSNLRNIITNSLGRNSSVDVDIDEIAVMDNDRILLCSDGLTTMVPDNIISSTVTDIKEPGMACSKLIDIANKNGGRDNITVVVVYIYKGKWSYNIKKLLGFSGR